MPPRIKAARRHAGHAAPAYWLPAASPPFSASLLALLREDGKKEGKEGRTFAPDGRAYTAALLYLLFAARQAWQARRLITPTPLLARHSRQARRRGGYLPVVRACAHGKACQGTW